MPRLLFAVACLLAAACASPPEDTGAPGDTAAGPALRVVTFNTGTTEAMGADQSVEDGYTAEHAAISDQFYGDGLAWLPAVEAAAAWFAEVDPDVVVFQEIFYSELCADMPEEARTDFVCETWQPGDPTVASAILGPDYQVACHPGKDDKCAAVHRRVGRFSTCTEDFCLEGLEGSTVEGCGKGARVGRGRIQTVDDGLLTLVNVHGSSGITAEDQACRVAQIDQVFVDIGDGEPGANGARNLVMGDLNTDPGRWAGFDESAARWGELVGGDSAFQWLTELGPEAPGSYGGVADIDHVMSDTFTGDCWISGIEDHDAVMDAVYFDHRPVVCDLRDGAD